MRLTSPLFAGLIAASLFSGCGKPGSAPTVPVTGVVRFKNEPVTDVRVIFTPAGGRPAFGQTDEQGRYSLTTFATDDGAVPGVHKVTISDRTRNWLPEQQTGEIPAGRFPERYQRAADTPWEFEVKEDGENVFDLNMEE